MLEEDKIKEDLKKLYGRLDQHQEKIDVANDSLGEIKYTLKGIVVYLKGNNEIDNTDNGLIGRLKELEDFVAERDKLHTKRMDGFDRLKHKGIGIIFGLSAGTGYAIADLIGKIFTKK